MPKNLTHCKCSSLNAFGSSSDILQGLSKKSLFPLKLGTYKNQWELPSQTRKMGFFYEKEKLLQPQQSTSPGFKYSITAVELVN